MVSKIKAFYSRILQVCARLARRPGRAASFFAALDREFDFQYLGSRLLNEKSDTGRYFSRFGGENWSSSVLVSIIVPTFDIDKRLLQEMVASLYRQSYNNWELCLCDDGSNNQKGWHYLGRLQKKNPGRFRIIKHESNRGISAATRTAIGLSQGEILVFVDADDLLHRFALEAIVRTFTVSADIDFIYTDNDFLSEKGFRRSPIRKPAWSPELLLQQNYIGHLTAIRRPLYDRLESPFSDAVNGAQDWDLCFRAANSANGIAHIPLVLYHWRKRKGSVADDPNAKPFALRSARLTRNLFLKNQDERLQWHTLPWSVRIKKNYRPGLVVCSVGRPATRQTTMMEYSIAQSVEFENESNLAHILRHLGKLQLDHETILLFLSDDLYPRGKLENMIGLAMLENVGCVWPFFKPGRRLGYTLKGNGLKQIDSGRFASSYLTGNVLTGPLHSLVIQYQKLQRVQVNQDLLNMKAGYSNQVGAYIGLELLSQQIRNVSSNQAMCRVAIPEISVISNLLPAIDPYN